jgi:hypothetical protein
VFRCGSTYTLPLKIVYLLLEVLEGLDVEDRFLFMLFLSWWFDQQPERFFALCAEIEPR